MSTMTETNISYDGCIDFDPEGGFTVTVCRTIPAGISGPFMTRKLVPVTNAIDDLILDAELTLSDAGYIPTEKWRVHRNGIVWANLIRID